MCTGICNAYNTHMVCVYTVSNRPSCKQAELATTFKRKLKSELFYLAFDEQPTEVIATKRLWFVINWLIDWWLLCTCIITFRSSDVYYVVCGVLKRQLKLAVRDGRFDLSPIHTTRIYGPYIRPVYTGSVYRALHGSSLGVHSKRPHTEVYQIFTRCSQFIAVVNAPIRFAIFQPFRNTIIPQRRMNDVCLFCPKIGCHSNVPWPTKKRFRSIIYGDHEIPTIWYKFHENRPGRNH